MKAPSRKQAIGVIQYVADVANVGFPGTSVATKGLIGGADFLLDRRKKAEESYQGSPGYLFGKAVGDADILSVFKKFPAKSGVALNISQVLKKSFF